MAAVVEVYDEWGFGKLGVSHAASTVDTRGLQKGIHCHCRLSMQLLSPKLPEPLKAPKALWALHPLTT